MKQRRLNVPGLVSAAVCFIVAGVCVWEVTATNDISRNAVPYGWSVAGVFNMLGIAFVLDALGIVTIRIAKRPK